MKNILIIIAALFIMGAGTPTIPATQSTPTTKPSTMPSDTISKKDISDAVKNWNKKTATEAKKKEIVDSLMGKKLENFEGFLGKEDIGLKRYEIYLDGKIHPIIDNKKRFIEVVDENFTKTAVTGTTINENYRTIVVRKVVEKPTEIKLGTITKVSGKVKEVDMRPFEIQKENGGKLQLYNPPCVYILVE